jgi:hypothetical protein
MLVVQLASCWSSPAQVLGELSHRKTNKPQETFKHMIDYKYDILTIVN